MENKIHKFLKGALYIFFIYLIIVIAGSLLNSLIQEYQWKNKIKITLEASNPYDYIEEVPGPETFRGVPTDILDRLIQSESSWRYTVINRQEDSRGLAQINMRYFPYFRETYGIKDPMNPWQSLCFAADYLYDLYLATGSWYEACLAYKCGLDGRSNAPEFIKSICRMIVEGGDR